MHEAQRGTQEAECRGGDGKAFAWRSNGARRKTVIKMQLGKTRRVKNGHGRMKESERKGGQYGQRSKKKKERKKRADAVNRVQSTCS